jgi:hypothetical protein
MDLTKIYAMVLCGVCALPILRFITTRRGAFLALFSFEFAQYYAVPVFILMRLSPTLGGADISPVFMQRALVYAILALIFVCVGYYVTSHICIVPHLRLSWANYSTAVLGANLACVIGIPAYYLLRRDSAGGAGGAFMVSAGALVLYGVVILFVLQLMGQLHRLQAILLWSVFLPARLLLGLATGATAQAIVVGLALLLAYVQIRQRLWWTAIILGVLFVFIVRPAMMPFRMLTWTGGPFANASRIEKLELFGTVVKGTLSGRFGNSKVVEQFTASRLCSICTLADVVRQTGSTVPYWNGESYYPLLFKPIPRFIWKNKPTENSGQTFGHRYGYISNDNFTSAYNLPQTIEMYINFGLPGILIGSFLFGILYRYIEMMFFHPGSGLGAVALGAVVMSQLLIIESATSGLLGGLMISLLVVAGLNFMVDFLTIISQSSRGTSAPEHVSTGAVARHLS